jgi:predicted transcriptional regulator
VIPIACLPEVPKTLHTVAKSRFRKESPFVQVWLDFEDVMRQRFGMVPDEPNVVLLDTRGYPQGVVSGHLDEIRYGEVVSAIDQLRLRSLQDRTAAVPAAATMVR